jgi:hypothetical protein
MSRHTGQHYNLVAGNMARFLRERGSPITHVNLIATGLLPTHLPRVKPEPDPVAVHPRHHGTRQVAHRHPK